MGNKPLTEFEYLDIMPCSTEVYIQILTQSKPIRLKTRLIGVHSQKAIILEFGEDKNWVLAKRYICDNASIVVRMFNSYDPNAHVIAFRSSISKLMSLHHWIIVYYPKNLERIALRQSGRIPVDIPSQLSSNNSDKQESPACSVQGNLVDISIQGGGFIGTEEEGINLDDKCTLTLLGTEGNEAIDVNVIIKNKQVFDAENNLIQYGLILDADQNDAERFVQKIILKHLHQ